jgi:hypothetical protein
MREDDLGPFAAADGLIAKMRQQPAGLMTDLEQDHLLNEACRNLAKMRNLSVGEAAELLAEFNEGNQLAIQCSQQFAVVSAYGRILAVFSRSALRGVVHPESN